MESLVLLGCSSEPQEFVRKALPRHSLPLLLIPPPKAPKNPPRPMSQPTPQPKPTLPLPRLPAPARHKLVSIPKNPLHLLITDMFRHKRLHAITDTVEPRMREAMDPLVLRIRSLL